MKELFANETNEIYNLSPLAYPWAYNMYKQARKNFWNPGEVNMTPDIGSFASLTKGQKNMFLDVFATLTTSDLVVQENIALQLYQALQIPELRLWLGHQIADESLHSHTYQHIIENLSLGDSTIYERYKEKPYIANKFTFAKQMLVGFPRPDAEGKIEWTEQKIKNFIVSLAFYYLGFEGIWFYHGFTPILALGRNGKMQATVSQLLYIARDEVTHVAFGVALLRSIAKAGYLSGDVSWRITTMLQALVDIEEVYANSVISEDVIGYSATDHINHTKYMVNYRLGQIGLPMAFPEHKEPVVSWLSELLENRKERNFFEQKITEYQVGAVDFSDRLAPVTLDSLWSPDAMA